MKAIATRPGARAAFLADLADLLEPAMPLAPDQVLCRTLEVGVCGTDREIVATAKPAVPRGEPFLVLGHECLARIEQVGADARGVAPGDLVVPVVRRLLRGDVSRPDYAAEGDYVERGIFHEHGFASRWWLDRPEHLYKVNTALRDVAVLAEPLAVGEKAVNEALALQRGRLGDGIWTETPPRVLVTGMGPIAVLAVLACSVRGWPVTICGRDAAGSARVDVVEALGAQYVRFTSSGDVPPAAFDLVLECTGHEGVLLAAARRLAPCGVMVWLGSSFEPRAASWNLARLMGDAIVGNHVHVGSVNAAPRDFRDALEHLEAGVRRAPGALAGVITHRVSPDDAPEHFTRRVEGAIKVVVEGW